MSAEIVVALVWLKLIVPVPDPNAIPGAEIVPAASLAPKPPMFRVPEEPDREATVIPSGAVEAATPPLATVRVP